MTRRTHNDEQARFIAGFFVPVFLIPTEVSSRLCKGMRGQVAFLKTLKKENK